MVSTVTEGVSGRRRLVDWRKERGLTQQDLATPMRVTRQAVSLWENGSTTPDINQARDIAEILGVPLELIEFGPSKRQRIPPKAPVHEHVAI